MINAPPGPINPLYTERPEGVVLPAPVPQVQVSLSKGSLEKLYFANQTFGTVRNINDYHSTKSQVVEKEKARIDPSRRNLPHSPPGFCASEAGHFDWQPRSPITASHHEGVSCFA